MTSAQRRANAAWLRAQLQGIRFTATLRTIESPELIRIIDALINGEEQIRAEAQPTSRDTRID